MKQYKIAVVPGDGIGHEVVPAALKVLDALGKKRGFTIMKDHYPWGAGNYLKHGEFMPSNGLEILRPYDAVFFGSVGLPEVDDTLPAREYTFRVRTGFQQYVNYRPVRTYPGFHGPLREKKAIDFAQTFAKRNALKHLSGIQKAPGNVWKFAVLAWRPTGNNIVKWDASQYAQLQDRVGNMIEGGSTEFNQNLQIDQGVERTSDDENQEGLESSVDVEDQQEPVAEAKQEEKGEVSKAVQQVIYLSENFTAEFAEAVKLCGVNPEIRPETYSDKTATEIVQKVSELVDAQN
jgi:hypothetical protein